MLQRDYSLQQSVSKQPRASSLKFGLGRQRRRRQGEGIFAGDTAANTWVSGSSAGHGSSSSTWQEARPEGRARGEGRDPEACGASNPGSNPGNALNFLFF